jgi:putative membrane protein
MNLVNSISALAIAALCAAPAGAQNRPATQTPHDARTFIHDLTIAGMAEVELGRMATQRGQHADVKAFGEMMVKDHTQAGTELKRVATSMNVQQPAELDQKHKDLHTKLSKLSGAAFDREYMNAMIMGHQEVEAKVRTRATPAMAQNTTSRPTGTTGDPSTATSGERQLNAWATKALPTVQHHLARAKDIQGRLK